MHYERIWKSNGFKIEIKKENLVANCNMSDGMSFDDIGLIMYGEGKIGSYEIGRTTNDEIIQFLNYASKYYQSNSKTYKKS